VPTLRRAARRAVTGALLTMLTSLPSVLPAAVCFATRSSSQLVEGNQRALMDLLDGKRIAVEQVDGSNAANKELRARLWALSGKRAVYPQLFSRMTGAAGGDGEYRFLGDWESISFMVENNDDRHALTELLKGLRRKQEGGASAVVQA
jgi:hypothetical protein